jgi:hypothetical protein
MKLTSSNMKLTSSKLLPLLLLLLFTISCSFINQLKKQAEADKGTQVITSTDNKSQLTVPGSWDKTLNVNKDASLQAGNILAGQYAIVISESKASFGADVTLDKFTQAAREAAKGNFMVSDMTLGDSRSVTINGYPAMQFEARGSAANQKLVWIYTTIDAPRNYHQVIAWTLASNFEQNKPILLDVANSFKEIDASVDSGPSPPRKKK